MAKMTAASRCMTERKNGYAGELREETISSLVNTCRGLTFTSERQVDGEIIFLHLFFFLCFSVSHLELEVQQNAAAAFPSFKEL